MIRHPVTAFRKLAIFWATMGFSENFTVTPATHCHRPLIYGFPLVFWCVSYKQNFGPLRVKFLLNQIPTHKMASFENTVTRI